MVKSHLHTYKRVRRSKTRYMCVDPECTHINTKDLIDGKKARCFFCGEEFILTPYDLTLARPKCLKCHGQETPKNEKEQQTSTILDILKGDAD